MTLKEKTVIIKVAEQVRKKLCNKYAGGYSDCYEYRLFKLCYEASESLQLALGKHKIFPFLIQGHIKNCGDHYWLEYKGNIIDLTACQFNTNGYNRFPLILIKPISKLKCFISESIV